MLNKCILIFAFVFLLGTYLSNGYPKHPDNGYILEVLVIVCISVFSFFFLRKETVFALKRQYLRVSYIFILSFLIVNFQAYIDLLLGNISINESFIWVNQNILSKAITISAIALILYFLGYSCYTRSLERKRIFKNNWLVNTIYLFRLGLFLFIVFIVTIDKSYLMGGYSLGNEGVTAQYAALFFEAVLFSIIIINCRNMKLLRYKSISFLDYLKIQKKSVILLLIYICTELLIGDRGPIIYLTLALLFGYAYVSGKKIPLTYLVILIVFASFCMTMVGIIRKQNPNNGITTNIQTALNENQEIRYYPQSFSSNTIELATSVKTLNYAVLNVPERRGYFYGLFFVENAFLFVPSLNNLFNNMLNVPKIYRSSGLYLTWLDQGSSASYGIGTSCVADTYLDFGLIGVIIVFFLFGYLTRILEVRAFTRGIESLGILILIFLLFSFSIYIARSSILYSFNKFTLIYVICLFQYYIQQQRSKPMKKN